MNQLAQADRGQKARRRLLATVLALAMAFSLWTGTAHGSYGAGDEAGDEPAPISSLEVFSPNGQIDMVDVPEDAFDEPSDRAAKSRSLPAADFEVEKLMDGGADADSIVVTIMGDGFTASQQDLFITKARQVVDYLTDKHPYKTFKNKFSVYAVKAISNQSGAAEQNGHYVDNYFGSKFYFDGSTERLLFTTRSDRVYDILDRYTPAYDTALVLVNSTKYGGAANGFAAISCAPQSNEIAVHENGHALGSLADEYLGIWRFEMPNMTRDSNPNTNKWKAWLGHENIGAYPYLGDPEEDPNWFRPHQSCEMRYLNKEYCAVCATQLTKVMADKTKEAFYGGRANSNALTHEAVSPGTARILDYAFYGCENLAGVEIPDSVTSIGRYAFLGCAGLTCVTNGAIAPQQIDSNVFADVNRSNVVLYVPAGTVSAYIAAGWTGFKQIVEYGSLTDPDGSRPPEVDNPDPGTPSTGSGHGSSGPRPIVPVTKKPNLNVVRVTNIRTPLKTLYIARGKSIKPPVVFYDGEKIVSPAVAWTTSNAKAASVNSKGKIKASKKIRKKTKVAIIGKTENGMTIKFNIYVVPKAKTVKKFAAKGWPKKSKMKLGKIAMLKIKVKTKLGTGAKVSFKSSKPSIIRIDRAGRMTALKRGKCKITVRIGKVKTTKKLVVAK